MSTASDAVRQRPLLVYLNVPFCNSKCHFCDWVAQVPVRDLRLTPVSSGRVRYLRAVGEQIHALAPRLRDAGYRPRIVYWGGGTASILTVAEIEALFGALSTAVDLSDVVEATIEGSPESLDLEKLRLLRRLGFNRISIGVQSLDNERLHRSFPQRGAGRPECAPRTGGRLRQREHRPDRRVPRRERE
ncbi:MAG: radical SAM protein [Actinomycetota bacterium]|nr:radical SAM protein [Actinomycetota bacterium]